MSMPAVTDVASRIAAIQDQIAALGGARRVEAPGATPAAGPSAFAGVLASAAAGPAPAANVAQAPPVGATPTFAGPSAGTTPFGAEIDAAAAQTGVDPALLTGLIRQESGFDPGARSPAGAAGLTQLMPGTARELGVTDPTDPWQAILGGAKYLRQQLDRFGGDPSLALAAYNAGPGAVQRFGGIPPYPETQQYVQKVLGYARQEAIA